jgi:hypothetical protein
MGVHDDGIQCVASKHPDDLGAVNWLLITAIHVAPWIAVSGKMPSALD